MRSSAAGPRALCGLQGPGQRLLQLSYGVSYMSMVLSEELFDISAPKNVTHLGRTFSLDF